MRTSIVFCLLLSSGLLARAGESVGWRGDGSGRFPDAQPPVEFGYVSKTLAALRVRAEKPVDAAPAGESLAGGTIHEWLVLGPLEAGRDDKKEETLPGEARFEAAEGAKVGELAWKKIAAPAGVLDLSEAFPEAKKSLAFAQTCVHAPQACEAVLALTTNNAFAILWLNGEEVYRKDYHAARIVLKLKAGWNRLQFKVFPGNKHWFLMPVFSGMPADPHEPRHLAWMTTLPARGWGGATIVKDRIFVQCEPDLLVCLDKASGKARWIRASGCYEAASDEERAANPAFAAITEQVRQREALDAQYLAGEDPAKTREARHKLQSEIQKALEAIDKEKYGLTQGQDELGHAGFNPVSDGERVYAFFAHGISVCYDLDGKRLWQRRDPHPPIEHGFASSPALADGNLIVYMRELMAFDKLTGKEAWRISCSKRPDVYDPGRFHSSFAVARAGSVEVILLGNGSVVRASDGHVLFSHAEMGTQQQIPTPVVEKGRVFKLNTSGRLFFYDLAEPQTDAFAPKVSSAVVKVDRFPTYYLDWFMASPLIHDGLVYLVNNFGVLCVLEAETGAPVYSRLLDLGQHQTHNELAARGVGASPVLGGDRIYLTGNHGVVLVIQPGREYKELARNRIDNCYQGPYWLIGERCCACPVCDGKRFYYRGENTLYAFEAK
ncbi:MAG: PQQ-binding-like beta-propeller repeat protein [Planctomycetota bacterium]|nr:PQQ-binding-like beta-propeller repeat protein [Planctomycetota bacterium]